MTITRKKKEWELTGEVMTKKPKKVYWGPNKGMDNYLLEVKLTWDPPFFPGSFHVIKEKLRKNKIWEDILASNYYGLRYCFTVVKVGTVWRLIDWQELGQGTQPRILEPVATKCPISVVPTDEKIDLWIPKTSWTN